MANTDSNLITNLDASPPVANEVGLSGARMRVAWDEFEVTGADFDAAADTVKLARLPANARIHDISVKCDALDGGTDSAVDVGIYDVDGNAKDQDEFASAVTTFRAAVLTWTELTNEARDIDGCTAELWSLAGYTAFKDVPKGLLDIVLTQTATVSNDADGTLMFRIIYTID